MADIKVKKKGDIAIKTLDRTAIMSSKLKENIVDIRDKTKESYETNENSSQEYAGNKIQNKVNSTAYYTGHKGNQIGRRSFKETKENIKKGKETISKIKGKIQKSKEIKKAGEKTVKTAKRTVKATKKTIKTAEKTAKPDSTHCRASLCSLIHLVSSCTVPAHPGCSFHMPHDRICQLRPYPWGRG